MSNILVTALGTINSSYISKKLNELDDNVIIGADVYPQSYIPASKHVDYFFNTPYVSDTDNFLNCIRKAIQKYFITLYIPVIDDEVLLLAEFKDSFAASGVIPCVSSLESVKICRNKYKTFEFIKHKIPEIYTKTYLLDDFNGQLEFPIFIKPVSGFASSECKIIRDYLEFDLFKNQVDPELYIVQEILEGQFYTADFIRDPQTGITSVIVREEMLRNKNGCGISVKIVRNKFIEQKTKIIADFLDYVGIGNVEFFFKNGNYNLIEINPRISAGIEYSELAGANMIENMLKIFSGIVTDLKFSINYGAIYSKSYKTYIME